MLVSKGVNWKAEGTSTRERKTNVNWRFANEDWHSLRRPAPFGDSDLIEFASCRGLLSVILSQRKFMFFACMWQDIFFKVDKTFDLLLKGYCYRMDYIKKITNWNIPSTLKKVPTCWVCPIDGHSTKWRNNRFWGTWKSPSPKRRHWGDGIRTEEIGTSLMTWNYMPGWAPHHSNLSRFLFLIIPACSEDPIIIYVIKLIRILQTLW